MSTAAPIAANIAILRTISTATVTMVLLKHGLRNVWLRGARPLGPTGTRVVGSAFTMRFVPGREDLATPAALASGRSTRGAIEVMPPDAVVVVDANGRTDTGIVGDILCARMRMRGVAALVTDGVVRDLAGVLATGLPVWCAGTASPPSVSGLTFAGWDEPVGCGGVAVWPGDTIVADGDGAVVIPRALVAAVVAEGAEQERFEAWVVSEVERGVKLPGLYPPDAETRARYDLAKDEMARSAT